MTTVAPLTSEVVSEWRLPRPSLANKDLLTHLYNRLDGAYPGRWSGQFRNQQAIDNWRDAWEAGFVQSHVTPAEVGAALSRLPAGWPPGLPDFIALCRPTVEAEAAFYEAVAGMSVRQRGGTGDWSHPAIYWAAVRIGRGELLGQGYSAMRTRWERALRESLAAGQWDAVPAPMPALAAPGSGRTGQAEAIARLAEMGAGGLLSALATPKAWPQQVLDRAASGRRPSPTVVRMAERAAAKVTA